MMLKAAMKTSVKLILLGLISAWTIQPLHAQLVSPTDITGTGAAVAICATTTITPACGNARWIQIIAPTTNAAVVRFGDSTVSATKGAALAAGGGMYLSPQGGPYLLQAVFLFIANGDKVTITWGL